MIDFIADYLGWFLTAICVAFFAFFGYAIYDEISSDKFYLRKDEWRCSQDHVEFINTWISTGKSGYMMMTPTTICDQWSRT